jgi:hypothetical protein
MSDIDIDDVIGRAETALGSETSAKVRKIDALIAKLEAKKEKSPFEPSRDVDAQISSLRSAKDLLRSGQPRAVKRPEAVRHSLPDVIDVKLETNATDPLIGLEKLPSPEADANAALSDQLFEFALAKVSGHLTDFRKTILKDKNDFEARFSQGLYRSLVLTLALMYAETKFTFALARDRRDDVRKELLDRIEALEARPFLTDAGVWGKDKDYAAGSFVSHQGAGWISNIQTKGCRPGDGKLWRLAVKSFKEKERSA